MVRRFIPRSNVRRTNSNDNYSDAVSLDSASIYTSNVSRVTTSARPQAAADYDSVDGIDSLSRDLQAHVNRVLSKRNLNTADAEGAGGLVVKHTDTCYSDDEEDSDVYNDLELAQSIPPVHLSTSTHRRARVIEQSQHRRRNCNSKIGKLLFLATVLLLILVLTGAIAMTILRKKESEQQVPLQGGAASANKDIANVPTVQTSSITANTTDAPVVSPTVTPTVAAVPTASPVIATIVNSTEAPTVAVTDPPTTLIPTSAPTLAPTIAPSTNVTDAPVVVEPVDPPATNATVPDDETDEETVGETDEETVDETDVVEETEDSTKTDTLSTNTTSSTTTTDDDDCVDTDGTFLVAGLLQRDCNWLAETEFGNVALCENTDVKGQCPKTCGVCV